jgi:uncharacterized Ntn-hydrolase superfamily protein
MKKTKPSNINILAMFILGILIKVDLYATWSIIAIDNETGEVGMAGASCTRNVRGIGEYVPGKGVVVVQAMSNDYPRELGIKMIREGATAKEIISAMRNNQYDPEKQQYGVIILNNDEPETYSGKQISDWNGTMIGKDFAVLGNTLVDENVVNKAFQAYSDAGEKHISERLMLALLAGAKAGGDKRCGKQNATSAFVTVYKPDDKISSPYINLYVYEMDPGGESAVFLLANEYERWTKYYKSNYSTQISVIPEKEELVTHIDGKMKATDYVQISMIEGTSIYVKLYAEVLESGIISRDKFVDLFSKITTVFIPKMLSESGLTYNDYKINTIEEFKNREVDIQINCYMDKHGIRIETKRGDETKQYFYNWDEV